jgi:FkbM family methyltransferase
VYDSYFTGKQNLTILDVGANIGLFSHYAYPYAERIFALEPASSHFDVMNHMFRFNKMDKALPLKLALSHENGKAEFYHNNNVTMYSLNPAVQSPELDTEIVDTMTIDKLFSEYNIDHVDFMKLDVEGAELDIIGSESFEKVADKIDTIYGEYHTWSGRNPAQLQTILTDLGFDYQIIPTDAVVFAATRRQRS